MIPIHRPDAAAYDEAASALRRGELVAMPTETVYGLAGHALDPQALAAIFAVKRRPQFDPLIVHALDKSMVSEFVASFPAGSEALMEKFWPGPLTLVLPRTHRVPDLCTSGLPTVAIRIPAHPVARELLRVCGFPLAAPSANPFGGLSPTRAEHVSQAFRDGIHMILDGGPCDVGIESTILGWENDKPVILRAGGIPIEDLEKVCGPIQKKSNVTTSPNAPGMLPWHYAPQTRLQILPGLAEQLPLESRQGMGLLRFTEQGSTRGFAAVETLSPSGNMHEAAARLFSCLHRLDAMGLKGIWTESVPLIGLGIAIMDRLQKASAKPLEENE